MGPWSALNIHGFNFDYTQLNVINKNNEVARVNFQDFPGFLTGQICGPNTALCGNQDASQILNGASNRYYRSKQVGAYVQDDIRVTPNLTLDVGLRWDWDGPLYEKNGMLTNFYPQDYSYNVATDTVSNIGLVVAGNNKTFGTKGVSNSTLTGRQWGFAPRIGFAYSPSSLRNVRHTSRVWHVLRSRRIFHGTFSSSRGQALTDRLA